MSRPGCHGDLTGVPFDQAVSEGALANSEGIHQVVALGANAGWVSVGTDHDTAGFAVATLRRWWQQAGRALDPTATKLLVCADAGGSNGYRVRAWKTELARFAAETGLAVTVCHFPPGTSKWNKVEHRLFSHISTNWRGRPLVSPRRSSS